MSEKKTFVTKEGYEKLQQDLEHLITVRRKEVSQAIQKARAFGDLSENSEYDEAKNEQAEIESRIAQLEAMLKTASIIEDDQIRTDVISVGCKVRHNRPRESQTIVVYGFDKVYEVGRIFRNEGMDASHNPEFTSIEMYQAYIDYMQMMDIIEGLYLHLAKTVCGSGVITYQGESIDLETPWQRLTMVEAVKKYAGVDYESWKSDEDARYCAEQHGVHPDEGSNATKGHVLIAFFEEYVEPKLIQPTFIYDYPVENSPLAKRKSSNPAFTERFEYFIYAREMGNAFSELNDPIDQRERFEKQVAAKRATGANAEVDEDFIMALEYGMPPTAGLGFGVDRLVMLLTDSPTIRDVLLFPTMKSLPNDK